MATEQQKTNAWVKTRLVDKYDPAQVRMDAYGSIIVWSEYGKTTRYGWEIDHELPKNGFISLSLLPANQRALHWKNNRVKSDKIDPISFTK